MTPSELRRRLLDLGVTPELSRDGRALWLDGLADEIADELVDEIVPSNVPWQPRAVSNQSGSGANPDLLVGDLADVCRDEATTTDVEYRQGIPSHAHIEAATRLGLTGMWHLGREWSDRMFREISVLTDEMVSFVQPGVGGPSWYWSPTRPEAIKRDLPTPPTPPTPPTRFSLLELDDDIVTTKPTLLHTDGKAPTAQQVRRYRDAMESRIGTDLTKAAKDAQLDEVAVYMLHRWLRGLDDVTVVDCIRFVHLSLDLSLGPKQVSQALLDERCEAWLQRYLKPTLDTREPVDTATQRRRQDVEEQRRRLADLAAKLAQERAADTTAPTEVTRWSLLELDGAAPVIEPTPMPAPQPAPDPLTVWWSRRAAQLAKRPAPSRFRIYLPPVPKRIDDWTTLPTELRDAALSYYVVVKGLEGLLN